MPSQYADRQCNSTFGRAKCLRGDGSGACLRRATRAGARINETLADSRASLRTLCASFLCGLRPDTCCIAPMFASQLGCSHTPPMRGACPLALVRLYRRLPPVLASVLKQRRFQRSNAAQSTCDGLNARPCGHPSVSGAPRPRRNASRTAWAVFPLLEQVQSANQRYFILYRYRAYDSSTRRERIGVRRAS